MTKSNYEFTERANLIMAITSAYRNGNISAVADELRQLAKLICINVLHFLNSGHSRTMNGKTDNDGNPKVINSYSKIITDCFLSLCHDRPNENAMDCLQECIYFLLDCLKKYNSLDKKMHGIRIMKLIYRHMSAYIKGNRAIIANTKTVFIDDYDGNEIIKLDKMQTGMIQYDNCTIADVDRSTAMIESLGLTQRQREILGYRLQGRSLQWICKAMNISETAVKKHMASIQDKAKKSDLISTDFLDKKAVVIKDKAVKECVKVGAFKDGELIGVYDSIGKCAIDLGLDKCHVSKCLNGQRASHKGYTFRIGN